MRWRDAPSEFSESAVLFGLAGFIEEKSESSPLGIIFNLVIPLLPIPAQEPLAEGSIMIVGKSGHRSFQSIGKIQERAISCKVGSR